MKNRRKNQRTVGQTYEKLAASYLQEQGITVLSRNYRCRQGEVDIVAREGAYLLFVEVKYRSSSRNGDPSEAVTPAKQRKLTEIARYYLYDEHLPEDTPVRFDVVAILGTDIRYIRNAFEQEII